MSTVLERIDGAARLQKRFTVRDDGAVVLENVRIASNGRQTSKKTVFPPAAYAPQTARQALEEQVSIAVSAGFALNSASEELGNTYTFMVELPSDFGSHVQDVVAAFGHKIETDPVTYVTSIIGTEFDIGTWSPTIRITATLSVTDAAQDQRELTRHIAIARCLIADFDLVCGSDVLNSQHFVVTAQRSGAFETDWLECLYRFGVFRRPVEIPTTVHTGDYAVGF